MSHIPLANILVGLLSLLILRFLCLSIRIHFTLQVLYQQPNPGIKYEYVLGFGTPAAPILDPLAALVPRQESAAATYRPTSYVNHPNAPNGNSATAFNTIPLFPRPSPSILSTPSEPLYPGDSVDNTNGYSTVDNQVHTHLHGHHGRRRGPHAHNLKAPPSDKKFYWKVVGYTNCSEPCGGGRSD